MKIIPLGAQVEHVLIGAVGERFNDIDYMPAC